jgi:hypothetical protein
MPAKASGDNSACDNGFSKPAPLKREPITDWHQSRNAWVFGETFPRPASGEQDIQP